MKKVVKSSILLLALMGTTIPIAMIMKGNHIGDNNVAPSTLLESSTRGMSTHFTSDDSTGVYDDKTKILKIDYKL